MTRYLIKETPISLSQFLRSSNHKYFETPSQLIPNRHFSLHSFTASLDDKAIATIGLLCACSELINGLGSELSDFFFVGCQVVSELNGSIEVGWRLDVGVVEHRYDADQNGLDS